MLDLRSTVLFFILRFLLGSIDCLSAFRERLDGWRGEIQKRRLNRGK